MYDTNRLVEHEIMNGNNENEYQNLLSISGRHLANDNNQHRLSAAV